MKQLKALFAMSKTQAAAATAVAASVVAPMSFAAGDVDFSAMIGGVVATGAVAAIVAMGVVKIAPNFAKWAVNKVASFF